MKLKLIAIVTVLCLIVTLVIIPLNPLVAKAEIKTGGTLRVAYYDPPETMNPLHAFYMTPYITILLVYETIGTFDDELNVVPRLADSWEYTSDGKQWTIHLAHNATFHDGTPLTSADVKFTLEYIVQGKDLISSPLYAAAAKIKYESIETPDNYTVVIKTKYPSAIMVSAVFPLAPILPKHLWSVKNVSEAFTWSEDELPKIGSGPFEFFEWTRNDFITLKANEHYRLGRPYLDKVTWRCITEMSTAVASLKTGEIDVIGGGITPTLVPSLTADPNIRVSSGPSIREKGFIMVNLIGGETDPVSGKLSKGNPALTLKLVRQAMDYAMDKQMLADLVYSGYAKPTTTYICPGYGVWHNTNTTNRGQNLTKAAELLDAAGCIDIDADGIRETTVEYPNVPVGVELKFNVIFPSIYAATEGRALETIQEWWRQIGIEMTYQSLDVAGILEVCGRWEFDLVYWGMYEMPDPDSLLFLCAYPTTFTYVIPTGYNSTRYEELYKLQVESASQAERINIVYEMQSILFEDLPHMMVYGLDYIDAYRTDKFEGFTYRINGDFICSNAIVYTKIHLKEAAPPPPAAVIAPETLIIVGVAVVVAVAAVSYAIYTRRKPPKAA